MLSEKSLKEIQKRLQRIDKDLQKIQSENADLPPNAINLLQYIITSAESNKKLQNMLAKEGFSSLGRSQAHIRHTIVKILQMINANLLQDQDTILPPPIGFSAALSLKEKNVKIFGKSHLHPAVMVTLPTQAADDLQMIKQLAQAGVTLFRINTAHDNPEIWQKMAIHIQDIRSKTNTDLKIYVDLAGPKIRTLLHKEQKIKVKVGDQIKVSKNMEEDQRVTSHSFITQIGCSNREIFSAVKVGDPVSIDDGKISGTVTSSDSEAFIMAVDCIASKSGKLKANKGINFPNTTLNLPALTKEDRCNLKEITAYADIIGLSFAQSATDVSDLIKALEQYQSNAAIVTKIETKKGVENLVTILLALITSNHQSGVMIARGDLAIEVGFENLPLIQQEIIDLCNAACLPVIYATQVLESKMKTNIPSRAEAIDAAYANRTDCIMLNKGTFAKEAVATLLHILSRYKDLYERNRHLLKVAHIWENNTETFLSQKGNNKQ